MRGEAAAGPSRRSGTVAAAGAAGATALEAGGPDLGGAAGWAPPGSGFGLGGGSQAARIQAQAEDVVRALQQGLQRLQVGRAPAPLCAVRCASALLGMPFSLSPPRSPAPVALAHSTLSLPTHCTCTYMPNRAAPLLMHPPPQTPPPMCSHTRAHAHAHTHTTTTPIHPHAYPHAFTHPALQASHKQADRNLQRTAGNLEGSVASIGRMEGELSTASDKYVFLQKLRAYVQDLCYMLQVIDCSWRLGWWWVGGGAVG